MPVPRINMPKYKKTERSKMTVEDDFVDKAVKWEQLQVKFGHLMQEETAEDECEK